MQNVLSAHSNGIKFSIMHAFVLSANIIPANLIKFLINFSLHVHETGLDGSWCVLYMDSSFTHATRNYDEEHFTKETVRSDDRGKREGVRWKSWEARESNERDEWAWGGRKKEIGCHKSSEINVLTRNEPTPRPITSIFHELHPLQLLVSSEHIDDLSLANSCAPSQKRKVSDPLHVSRMRTNCIICEKLRKSRLSFYRSNFL